VLFLPASGGDPDGASADEEGDEAAERAGDAPPVTSIVLHIVTRLGLALRTKAVSDELRAADQGLRAAVLADPLTGLGNRLAAEHRLRAAIELAEAGGGPVSAVLADLDGFAEVNESWGYALGDQLLQAFGGLLHESCRAADTVARFGGGSFLVVLPRTRLDAAWYVAERVRRRTVALAAAFGPEPRVTASFGVVEQRRGERWSELLGRAETALRRAKRAGRNRCEVA
jgi:diguanylate cyclase (GGDEF)-like protein